MSRRRLNRAADCPGTQGPLSMHTARPTTRLPMIAAARKHAHQQVLTTIGTTRTHRLPIVLTAMSTIRAAVMLEAAHGMVALKEVHVMMKERDKKAPVKVVMTAMMSDNCWIFFVRRSSRHVSANRSICRMHPTAITVGHRPWALSTVVPVCTLFLPQTQCRTTSLR